MPRTHIRKGGKNQWTTVQLEAALKAVESGESVHGVAAKFGIPKSTLHDHVKGKSTKRFGGPSTVLTPAEEKEVATSCAVLQEVGFPLTRSTLSIALRDYIEAKGRANPFTDGIPGRAWWSGFFNRNPQLSQHLPRNRTQAATPEVRGKKVY